MPWTAGSFAQEAGALLTWEEPPAMTARVYQIPGAEYPVCRRKHVACVCLRAGAWHNREKKPDTAGGFYKNTFMVTPAKSAENVMALHHGTVICFRRCFDYFGWKTKVSLFYHYKYLPETISVPGCRLGSIIVFVFQNELELLTKP